MNQFEKVLHLMSNMMDLPWDQKSIKEMLYRYQLEGVLFFSVGKILIIKGDDAFVKKARHETVGREKSIIHYLKEAASCYWVLLTMDQGILPYRFAKEMRLSELLQKRLEAISAMPCEYDPGLFDAFLD